MTKSSQKCCITEDKCSNNRLLENILHKTKYRVDEYNDKDVTEPPSTIVLTFKSNKIDVHNTTFKLIREVCINFKTVVILNVKPSLFMALFHQLDRGISNIEALKVTTHSAILRESLLFCFAAQNLFYVNVSINPDYKKLENFLNYAKRPYSIYFPPYHKLSLAEHELSSNEISYAVGCSLLSNPRFVSSRYYHKDQRDRNCGYAETSKEKCSQAINEDRISYTNHKEYIKHLDYLREDRAQLGLGI